MIKIQKSKLRGHNIEFVNDHQWVYSDTKEPTMNNWQDRPCGRCGKHFTKEGYDACLSTLPGIMNACCGHGNNSEAYVQFLDEFSIHGEDAITILEVLKKYKKEATKC